MKLPTSLALLSPSFTLAIATNSTQCKTTPDSPTWPNATQWASLNTTLSGRLIQPLPPAAACHASFPSVYNNLTCASIAASWSNFSFHQNNPVSTAWNNMNNDSCLPIVDAPCSGAGYPVYVVNATSAQDVKAALDFARQNSIRVNVKASGHDYLARSTAPNALSIWTRYLTGNYTFFDAGEFVPQGCNASRGVVIDSPAVTAGAGSYVSELYEVLNEQRNQTLVDGMGREVTMGGYLTGGGHSPLSAVYGLGADQVLEVEMVVPSGEIVVANECQNEDLFWAVRGGGGGTFGVLTSITVRTIPNAPIAVYDFQLRAAANSSEYWDAVTFLVAQFPYMSSNNVSAFTYLYPNTSGAAIFEAVFVLPDPEAYNVTIEELWGAYWTHVNETLGNQTKSTASYQVFPNLYETFLEYADDSTAGVDKVVGSWLLPPETLTADAFREALVTFLGADGGRLYMVSGKGVWDAEPRGGSDAVNPAWRKALIHAVTSQDWTPLNETERALAEYNVNNVQTEALRQLVPDSGAYVNEAYWKEPNFQQAFWGSNYDRLLEIKRTVDPDDVFWCRMCVGSEGWEEVGDSLCRI